MIASKSISLGARILVCGLTLAFAFSQESRIGKMTGEAKRGAEDYRRYCAGCHGEKGNGEGENALHLDPRPRDFTAGVFKCRSTPTGSLPLDDDLFNTISRGLHASAMPSWAPLMRQQRVDLVAYIKGFCPRFKDEKPEAPIAIPPETAASAESVTHGKELYNKMECFKCHGTDGHGNGPAAVTLTDSKGRPISPYDFTSGERFKCGETNEDLYRIFMTGLDGTPMPSFADNIKPEDAWDLVHYLRTLQGKEMEKKSLLTRIHPGSQRGKVVSSQASAQQRTHGN